MGAKRSHPRREQTHCLHCYSTTSWNAVRTDWKTFCPQRKNWRRPSNGRAKNKQNKQRNKQKESGLPYLHFYQEKRTDFLNNKQAAKLLHSMAIIFTSNVDISKANEARCSFRNIHFLGLICSSSWRCVITSSCREEDLNCIIIPLELWFLSYLCISKSEKQKAKSGCRLVRGYGKRSRRLAIPP